MPHFTLNIDAAGPIVNAGVNVSQARKGALLTQHRELPPVRIIRALVDTGASFTSIEPGVLSVLGLTPTRTIDIVTPSTGTAVHTTETYEVDLVIGAGPNDIPLTIPNLRIAACELFL